jgi:hypothetical protein
MSEDTVPVTLETERTTRRGTRPPLHVQAQLRARLASWVAVVVLIGVVGAALALAARQPGTAPDGGPVAAAGPSRAGTSTSTTTTKATPATLDGDLGPAPETGAGKPAAQRTDTVADNPAPDDGPPFVDFSCIESLDPACGDLRWSVEPVGTSASATWRLEPAAPAAGEPFDLVISWSDAEASRSVTSSWCMPSGDGHSNVCGDGLVAPCGHHGLWAPTPPAGSTGEVRYPMTLEAGIYFFDWSSMLGSTDSCEVPDPWRETVAVAGSFTVAGGTADESLTPGRYREHADNSGYAQVDTGTDSGGGSATQLTRDARRITFHVYLHCPATGRTCTVSVSLENTAGRDLRFDPHLSATVTAAHCDGSGDTVTVTVADPAVTGLAPGGTAEAATPVTLPSPGQWCVAGTVDIELL